MTGLEAVCLAIVGSFVAVRARIDPEPRRFLWRLAVLVAAAWVAENSVIHAYHFYEYSPSWSLFVDHVPLMIVLIWPVVVHSAWDLARHLLGDGHRRVPLLAATFILFDASLMEPIAVEAGLWRWTEPGLFRVPPIGILGWAIFAFFAVTILRRSRSAVTDLSAILLPALGTHLLLLIAWWTFFRWVNGPVPAWSAVLLVWLLSVGAVLLVRRGRLFTRVPRLEMLLRAPAALFFFALLVMHGRDAPALVAYAAAFAPPYLVLTPWRI